MDNPDQPEFNDTRDGELNQTADDPQSSARKLPSVRSALDLTGAAIKEGTECVGHRMVPAPSIELPNQEPDYVSHIALDIGGSLIKLVYFSPDFSPPSSASSSSVGGESNPNAGTARGGRLHFVKFETNRVDDCIAFIEAKGLHRFNGKHGQKGMRVKATGGGAYKLADIFMEKLGVVLEKEDEMACLVSGCNFLLKAIHHEAFTYEHGTTTFVPTNQETDLYPYLLVNIGSGVSMVKVEGPDSQFERVSGSSLGGGTFWGLSRLLTKRKDFDDMLELSMVGDNASVDMLVGDIYGGRDYGAIGLSATTIASSFGKVIGQDQELEDYDPADLTVALCRMVSYNIGQLAYLNAMRYGIKRIFFGGFFIRGHPYTMETISYAIRFWSKGEMAAMFLRHEGFLGAVGSFLTVNPMTPPPTDTEVRGGGPDSNPGKVRARFVERFSMGAPFAGGKVVGPAISDLTGKVNWVEKFVQMGTSGSGSGEAEGGAEETGAGAGPGSGAGAGPGPGSGAGAGPGPGAGSGSGSGPEPGPGQASGPGQGSGAGPGPGSGSWPGQASGPGSGAGPEAGPGPGQESGPGQGSATGPGPEPGAGEVVGALSAAEGVMSPCSELSAPGSAAPGSSAPGSATPGSTAPGSSTAAGERMLKDVASALELAGSEKKGAAGVQLAWTEGASPIPTGTQSPCTTLYLRDMSNVSRKESKGNMALHVGVLHYSPSLEPFPLLADASSYDPNTLDISNDEEELKWWLKVLDDQVPVLVEKAIASEGGGELTRRRGMACGRAFGAHMHKLRAEPGAYGRLGLAQLFEMREECLREFGFTDVYRLDKERENSAALTVLPDLLNELDNQNIGDRWLSLMEGALAANIFDWGARSCVELYQNGTILDIYRSAREKLGKRPWAVDQFDSFKSHLLGEMPQAEGGAAKLGQRPWAVDQYEQFKTRLMGAGGSEEVPAGYRRAMIFVDNSGADVVLGMLPLTRELLRMGCEVVLVANSLPAINDITAPELRTLLSAASQSCPIIKEARNAALKVKQLTGGHIPPLERGGAKDEVSAVPSPRLYVIGSGHGSPCIDFTRVPDLVAEACVGTDLLIIEGMGRAVHTNLYTRFNCDTLKLAMIKTGRLAKRLFNGNLYDCICLFEDAATGKGGMAPMPHTPM